jgi:hypothetical protein
MLMKKLCGLALFALLLAPALFAQEHYTEGPVWRVDLVRVKPTHIDEYLTPVCDRPANRSWKRRSARA